MSRLRPAWLFALTTAVLATSCVGVVNRPGDSNANAGVVSCPDEARPEAAPLRRLDAMELENTLRDLFGGLDLPAVSLPSPTPVEGYTTHSLSQPNTPILVEGEIDVAISVADVAAADLSSWAPCTETTQACLDQIVDDFLLHAYRRPPTAEERDRAHTFASTHFSRYGFTEAVRDFVAGVLLSPQFLFRPEVGTGSGEDGLVALTGYEVASRLSYLLLRTMPDDALFAAAAAGDLDTADGVETEARRLLDDERASATLDDFFAQWLELDDIDGLTLSAELYPELDGGLRASLRGSVEAFVRDAAFEQHSLDALFTSDRVFVDARLATLLDASGPSDGFAPVSLPHRHGILTQPGILAATSHGEIHSPVGRGLKVLDRVLCIEIDAPPIDVNAAVPDREEGEVLTTRQHFEQTHQNPTCLSCHNTIDGVGYSFENFDALGRYRTEENGQPIDATGVAPLGTGELTVDGAEEFATAIEGQRQVRYCVSEHLHRYAFGRTLSGRGDRCQVGVLADTWEETGGDPIELVVGLVRSPTFRYRPVAE